MRASISSEAEACPEVIVQLVREGKVSEERIDQSIRRLLREKFRLGLFDNPYLDVDAAEKIVGQAEFRQAGELAQRKSIVLLKNEKQTLPLKRGTEDLCGKHPARSDRQIRTGGPGCHPG